MSDRYEYKRAWRARNKERIQAEQRAWREQNSEHVKEHGRKYRKRTKKRTPETRLIDANPTRRKLTTIAAEHVWSAGTWSGATSLLIRKQQRNRCATPIAERLSKWRRCRSHRAALSSGSLGRQRPAMCKPCHRSKGKRRWMSGCDVMSGDT
jgi:hypothetical protein